MSVEEALASALAGSYRIDRELGGGGMSRVFVATELALSRAVVVKVVSTDALEGTTAERFTRVVRLAVTVNP